MKKYMMIHDENLCIGCQGCSVACRSANNVPRGLYRLQVHAKMSGTFPNLKTDFLRQSCVMCEDAPCVEVCPTNALTFGDVNDENSKISKKLKESKYYLPKAELKTKPSLAMIANTKGAHHE